MRLWREEEKAEEDEEDEEEKETFSSRLAFPVLFTFLTFLGFGGGSTSGTFGGSTSGTFGGSTSGSFGGSTMASVGSVSSSGFGTGATISGCSPVGSKMSAQQSTIRC